MEAVYSLLLALEDLKDSFIAKITFLNGLFWIVLWGVVAFFTWGYMLKFTSFMITLLPFKFVQSAGAEFVFMIAWLQVVLVTIGVVFSIFNQYVKNRFFTMGVTLISAVVWLFVFMSNKSSIIDYIQNMIKIFPFESIEEAVSNVLGVFIFYSLFIMSLYMGFLINAKKVISYFTKKDYPEFEIADTAFKFKTVVIILRDFTIFFIALILLYPLLFVPFLNLLLIMLLWAYIIKNALVNTVESVTGAKIENSKAVWFFVFMSVVLNFLPLINLYAPALGLLGLYHYVMEKKTDILEK